MNNVLILGAGASFDAGIPLLSGFVDKMWEFALRRTANGKALSSADIETFDRAVNVRNDLSAYHGRASFDDRNIEDLLSILSFNALAGDRKDRAKLEAFNQAITRTIELSCEVRHPGVFERGGGKIVEDGDDVYRQFWLAMFDWVKKGNALPSILTFNYDLVLERALLQILIGTRFDAYDKRLPFDGVRLSYLYEQLPDIAYDLKYVSYGDVKPKPGTVLVDAVGDTKKRLEIEILKLHGSTNFPKKKWDLSKAQFNFAATQDEPFILPPIFNKLSTTSPNKIWSAGQNRLRDAINVIFVGYSLPRTDIYMQYFLKAALGPNANLNRVFVFDPVLYRNDDSCREMKLRYEDCFAPQLRSRITFTPDERIALPGSIVPGSFKHFVNTLRSNPRALLF